MLRSLIISLLFFGVSAIVHADGMDLICSNAIKNSSFVSGDTVRWETKVIPDLRSIISHPGFNKLAADNANYKMQLTKFKINENEIRSRNRQRIIREAARAGFDKSLSSRAQCTRDFIEKSFLSLRIILLGVLDQRIESIVGRIFKALK